MVSLAFEHPIYLWFLFGIPLLILVHYVTIGKRKRKALKFANFEAIARVTGGEIVTSNNSLLVMRLFVVLCVILAAAGTTVIYTGQTTDFDFVLAIDTSSSMAANDFQPNRLEAVKTETKAILSDIDSANIGLITFSGVSFVEKGLTNDLIDLGITIDNINISIYGGTDLSSAIITSTNLLLESDNPRTVIILTDGRGNIGAPLVQAVNYANSNGVAVSTIGIGTDQGGQFNIGGALTSLLDEYTLMTISNATEGKYYKADSQEALKEAYRNILDIDEKKIRNNISILLIVIALVLLFLEWSLVNTKYKTIP